MRKRITSLLVAGLAVTAVGVTPGVAAAKHGADDPAGHVRQARGADDAAGHQRHSSRTTTRSARRGRGRDDAAGHVRHGHGADDGPNHS
ncbi:MAG: hypothetical protein QOI73_1032 [Solirubrobacteraceae bacterium]|nr:hypothetical protein [Solirubrobacteraceae bacterium]